VEEKNCHGNLRFNRCTAEDNKKIINEWEKLMKEKRTNETESKELDKHGTGK
jgi:hypothetical protein